MGPFRIDRNPDYTGEGAQFFLTTTLNISWSQSHRTLARGAGVTFPDISLLEDHVSEFVRTSNYRDNTFWKPGNIQIDINRLPIYGLGEGYTNEPDTMEILLSNDGGVNPLKELFDKEPNLKISKVTMYYINTKEYTGLDGKGKTTERNLETDNNHTNSFRPPYIEVFIGKTLWLVKSENKISTKKTKSATKVGRKKKRFGKKFTRKKKKTKRNKRIKSKSLQKIRRSITKTKNDLKKLNKKLRTKKKSRSKKKSKK
jgi:hypothetical protein